MNRLIDRIPFIIGKGLGVLFLSALLSALLGYGWDKLMNAPLNEYISFPIAYIIVTILTDHIKDKD